jgi:hypothetical protein
MVILHKYAMPTLICLLLLAQYFELNRESTASSGTTLMMLCVQSLVLVYLGVRWIARMPEADKIIAQGERRNWWRHLNTGQLLPVHYIPLHIWYIYDWGLVPFNYMLQGLGTLAVLSNHLLRGG